MKLLIIMLMIIICKIIHSTQRRNSLTTVRNWSDLFPVNKLHSANKYFNITTLHSANKYFNITTLPHSIDQLLTNTQRMHKLYYMHVVAKIMRKTSYRRCIKVLNRFHIMTESDFSKRSIHALYSTPCNTTLLQRYRVWRACRLKVDHNASKSPLNAKVITAWKTQNKNSLWNL